MLVLERPWRRGEDLASPSIAKHIDVQYLWVQAKVADQEVMLIKIPGEENRSELMTKYLQAPKQDKLLEALGYEKVSGQSKLALKAA